MRKTFQEILDEERNRRRNSALVCVALLSAGIVLLVFRHLVGWLFLCLGAILGYALLQKYSHFREELSAVQDADAFCREFDREDGTRFPLLGLTLLDEYTVLEMPSLRIYPMKEMEKFEVGLQGNMRKVLFLTDRKGVRHQIAETQKGDALQEEFDGAYEAIREYFRNRKTQ